MNEELKHHASGLAKELKKAAEEFMNKMMPKDLSYDAEAKIVVKSNGKTYEKKAAYKADLSSREIKEDE